MAKKKRRRSTGARKASGGGRTPNWKRSKALAAVLIMVIVVIWGGLLYNMFAPPPPAFTNFPYTYITEDEDAKPIVIRADSNKKKQAPFKRDGKWYWDAYQCNNKDCPARGEDGKPFIFPYVIGWVKKRIEEGKPPYPTPAEMRKAEKEGKPLMGMEMEMMEGQPQCPACASENLDASNVSPYQTPEGRKIQEEYRKRMMAKYAKENKGKKKRKRRR